MIKVAVIMAGGRGQRFWPLSTAEKPKQFLDLENSGRSLLQSSYDRAFGLVNDENNIFIATSKDYLEQVREQLPDLPLANIILEPVGRDSAPAIALAALTIAQRFDDAVMMVFPSDHRITKVAEFHADLEKAISLAESGKIVTIGIKPDRPATGYGYIKQGTAASFGSFEVEKFIEKPNLENAQNYLESGLYLWNAGIFVWQVKAILAELARFEPSLMADLKKAFLEGKVAEVFPLLKRISIDYAVMEKTQKAFVIPSTFDWDDLGDWLALERLHKSNASIENTVHGDYLGFDDKSNIVFNEDPETVIIGMGIKDLVIVKRGKVILIIGKDKVQDIKTLLENPAIKELEV